MKRQILSITQKELNSYFGSLLAVIFLGTFLAAVLFIFFTVETFFANGAADLRPLFRWMPILLIFLLAALTMRQWSEEQRAGTQELLLTLPVPPYALVLGKFLAVMTMIGLALALTLPLPLTVSLLGNLDWGPVIGGYVAALLMAGAYAAIGLIVSSRTDNQIVALIATILLGGLFFILGTSEITNFFGGAVSAILWAMGTGSRFESIQRGVIDLRDLVYYLSLIGIFLTLNTISLDSIRWSQKQEKYRQRVRLSTALILINLLLINVWLYPLQGLRLDLTQQKEYSLSATTKDLFDSLQEPLLIRAYVSERTHPLLAPLVPRIRDMLREYEIASDGRITTEVIDPVTDPEIEAEANQTYGIQPFPFQVSGRYEASVINAYFHILVRYGDQSVVLNFQDIVDVDTVGTELNVYLSNLEYDLTSSIKKVVFGFQSVDSVLAALDQPVTLTFYLTANTLPDTLTEARTVVSGVAQQIAADSNGKFIYSVVDLDDPNSGVSPGFLKDTYGLDPIPVSFFGTDTYYAHMILQNGEQLELLYPPANLSEGDVRTTIEASLKRTSSGFLKVIGIWSPSPDVSQSAQLGGGQTGLFDYNVIASQLSDEYELRQVDLSSGQISPEIDMLLLLAPQNLADTDLFAIDQFLMRGGAVTMAISPFQLNSDQFTGGINLLPANTDNVLAWLQNYGITLTPSLVMDSQNQPFPVVAARNVGGAVVQEVQAVDYPFFVDVRPNNMDTDNPIASNLTAVTLNWASPVQLDETVNADRDSSVLMSSSNGAWLQTDNNVLPNYDLYPDTGFLPGTNRQSYPLAVTVQGRFNSYFADKPSPFETQALTDTANLAAPTTPTGKITESPDSARLVVIGSAAFVEDNVLNLAGFLNQTASANNLQFMRNVVDWSVEDLDLLAIRGRGTATRVLQPMTEQQQASWEAANYVIALLALIAVYVAWRRRIQNERPLVLVEAENLL
jgi:ABC-2 type transport system permease protein